MTHLVQVLPPHVDIALEYSRSSFEDQHFIADLAIFLSSFFKNHLPILETPQHRDVLLQAHEYLAKITYVDDIEVFKITLEYWHMLAESLYQESPWGSGGLNLGQAPSPRRELYAETLHIVRFAMISKMAKPEEV